MAADQFVDIQITVVITLTISGRLDQDTPKIQAFMLQTAAYSIDTVTGAATKISDLGSGDGFGSQAYDNEPLSIPEPTTLALMGLSLSGIRLFRREYTQV
jgi:hypothetical protein